ncbi:MAG: N-acetyltransferase [Rhodospirillaceae bacterium]|nr:N-acetyltransferase [Rhodospirillaceae bacterium]
MLVRSSEDGDLPAIQAIYAHHVLHGFGSFEEVPPDMAELARRRTEFLARGMPYLVAEAAGQVLGYAYASPFRPRSAYRFTVENSIYVDPAAARRGVGRGLLGELIRHCTALGFRQMVAVIGDSQNTASIRLHEAMGFRHAGRLVSVGRKKGRWLDSVMMQLTLGAGDSTEPPR